MTSGTELVDVVGTRWLAIGGGGKELSCVDANSAGVLNWNVILQSCSVDRNISLA